MIDEKTNTAVSVCCAYTIPLRVISHKRVFTKYPPPKKESSLPAITVSEYFPSKYKVKCFKMFQYFPSKGYTSLTPEKALVTSQSEHVQDTL